MKPYHRSKGITLYQGKVEDVLPGLVGAFDASLCDPPYGLAETRSVQRHSRTMNKGGFMGMKWDARVPGPDTWAEVLRVLKPGAPLMAFGGPRTFHRLACAIEDGGFLLADTLCWLHGQGFPKGHAQLKPAWEPITLAWKKGKRLLAIDAGRIGTAAVESGRVGRSECTSNALGTRLMGTDERHNSLGRWPANVLLDEESAAALDLMSGRVGGSGGTFGGHAKSSGWRMGLSSPRGQKESGASRFFYCAKASRAERGEGNTHPTVKPLKLLEYLARLILPPKNGTPRRLLVPFSGSGSEMIAARKAGWDEVIGIELNREYCALSTARLGLKQKKATTRAA